MTILGDTLTIPSLRPCAVCNQTGANATVMEGLVYQYIYHEYTMSIMIKKRDKPKVKTFRFILNVEVRTDADTTLDADYLASIQSGLMDNLYNVFPSVIITDVGTETVPIEHTFVVESYQLEPAAENVRTPLPRTGVFVYIDASVAADMEKFRAALATRTSNLVPGDSS